MSHVSRWSAVAVLLSAAAAAWGSNAFPHLSMDSLVAQSDIIVTGKVVRSWSSWDSEHRFIWTHHEIQISQTLKGRTARTVVVSEPGGVLEGLAMRIPGAAEYAVGEEVSVCLYKTPIGFLRTTNYGQGKMAVRVSTELRQAIEKVNAK